MSFPQSREWLLGWLAGYIKGAKVIHNLRLEARSRESLYKLYLKLSGVHS